MAVDKSPRKDGFCPGITEGGGAAERIGFGLLKNVRPQWGG